MNCRECNAYLEDPQTGDDYCKEMEALISPWAVKCPRQQAENKWPVGGVDRTGKTDKISLENAVETPFWMAIWATEPERMVEVEMSYSDLKILCDLIDEKRKDKWIPVEKYLPEGRINPMTNDFYEYQVTAKFGEYIDIRHYKFGRGHWWHGPAIVDKYVIAWRPIPDPYEPKEEI